MSAQSNFRWYKITFPLVFLAACNDATVPTRVNAPTTSNNATGTTTPTCLALTASSAWDSGVGTIFQNTCAGCHPNYSTYANVVGNIGAINSAINPGGQMASKINSTDLATVNAWIAANEPQSAAQPVTPPTPSSNPPVTPTPAPTPSANPPVTPTPAPNCNVSSLTYANNIAPILKNSCVSCHNATTSQGGVALDTYASVKTNFDNSMSAISSNTMPKAGGTPVSSDQVTTLNQWKAQGFPQ